MRPKPRTAPPAKASRPQRDLAAADTDAVVHNLYVKIVSPGDSDVKSKGFTLEILKYIHGRIGILKQMGLQVKVNKITSRDLKNERLRDAMKKRGIAKIPALTTPTNIYLGNREIVDIYERNIREFTAVQRREVKHVEGLAKEDDLEEYYKSEMSFERAEEDEKEPGIGETDGDMMSSYQSMMQRRDDLNAKRRPARATVVSRARREAEEAPAAGHSSRPDNVSPAPRRAAPATASGDDDEIASIINKMAQDIDTGTMAAAFQSPGGDSLEGGEGADPQDRIMEQSYWANQESSL